MKKNKEDVINLTKEQKENLLLQTKKEHDESAKKRSFIVYICQTVAFFAIALAIPEAILNKEYLFMAFLIVGTISLLFPFIYMASESEHWKQIKKLEEDLNADDKTDTDNADTDK
ncbi:MAG: hypothetical protein K6G10_01530 [Butyrivibrio sp.]|nr:hypothetical protein [Butyrivibrio sp.]